MVDAWIRILISHLCIAFGLLIVSFQWMTSLSRPVKGSARVAAWARALDHDYNILADIVRASWLTEKENTRPIMHRSILKPRAQAAKNKSRKSDQGTRALTASRSIIRMNESRQTITEPTLTQLRVSLGISEKFHRTTISSVPVRVSGSINKCPIKKRKQINPSMDKKSRRAKNQSES